MEGVSGESTGESFIAVERAEGAEDVEDVFAAFYAAAHARAAQSQRPMPWGGDAGWQKVGNALARDMAPKIREKCAEAGVVWERYLSNTWKEIMEDLHGPD